MTRRIFTYLISTLPLDIYFVLHLASFHFFLAAGSGLPSRSLDYLYPLLKSLPKMSSDSASIPSRRTLRERGEGNSSEESNASLIDSHDPYRVGGPGPLPEWPVRMDPASDNFPIPLRDAVVKEVEAAVLKYGLRPDLILPCCRYSAGSTPQLRDDTIYIRLAEPADVMTMAQCLSQLLEIPMRLHYQGIFEIVDQRAAGGWKSYAVDVPPFLRQNWPDIENIVINQLTEADFDWQTVMLANRGYWEEEAVPTVLIKARTTEHRRSVRQAIAQAMDGYGLAVEIIKSDLMWGLLSDTNVADTPSLVWPLTDPGDLMGISIGRTGEMGSGTLGGYLRSTTTDRSASSG